MQELKGIELGEFIMAKLKCIIKAFCLYLPAWGESSDSLFVSEMVKWGAK